MKLVSTIMMQMFSIILPDDPTGLLNIMIRNRKSLLNKNDILDTMNEMIQALPESCFQIKILLDNIAMVYKLNNLPKGLDMGEEQFSISRSDTRIIKSGNEFVKVTKRSK